MLFNIVLALHGLATVATARSLSISAAVKRDVDDVFTFNGAGGTRYYALIRSQTNRDESPYTVDEGVTAWDNGQNEIAQNLQSSEIAAQTDLADGNTIFVTGNMIDDQPWASIGGSTEWGSIIDALSLRTIQEDGPEYFYLTLGTNDDVAFFFASITLSWINSA